MDYNMSFTKESQEQYSIVIKYLSNLFMVSEEKVMDNFKPMSLTYMLFLSSSYEEFVENIENFMSQQLSVTSEIKSTSFEKQNEFIFKLQNNKELHAKRRARIILSTTLMSIVFSGALFLSIMHIF